MNSFELRCKLRTIAKERAEQDFQFAIAGKNTPMNLTPDQLETVKQALLFYAQNGALEALNYLKNHAYLKP